MQGAGCAVTALAMALQSAGININPQQLNQFAVSHFDFTPSDPATGRGGDIIWDRVVQDLAADSTYNPSRRPLQFNQTSSSVSDDYLSNQLTQGTPVIIGDHLQSNGTSGHFVLVVGKTCNADGSPNFSILDPGDKGNTGLSPQFQGLTVRGFVTDPSDLSQLDFSVNEPVQLTLVDPVGLSSGWDVATNSVLQNAPNAYYHSDRLVDVSSDEPITTTGRFLDVYEPAPGLYTLTITGIEAGTYRIQIGSSAADGSLQPATSNDGIAGVRESSFPAVRGATCASTQ
jgi:hypothetical protein